MKTHFGRVGILALLLVALAASQLQAQTVVYSGTDSTLDFGTASGSFTLSGLQLTLSANDGIVNATSTGLGINDSGSGDDTDGLDTINVVEVLTFSFDKDITFDSISLVNLGPDDGLALSFNGGSAINYTSSSSPALGNTLLAGQNLTITAIEPNAPTPNNGVNITSFQVTVIPEPMSYLLIFLGLGVLYFIRRRSII